MGYNTTIKYFKNNLIKKKIKILPHYQKILKELNEIKSYIMASKYILAKNKLAEWFVVIAKCRKLVDAVYFDLVLSFYEEYLNNLFITFGVVAIVKEKEQMLSKLTKIIDDMSNRIEEIESFVSTNSLNH